MKLIRFMAHQVFEKYFLLLKYQNYTKINNNINSVMKNNRRKNKVTKIKYFMKKIRKMKAEIKYRKIDENS